MKGPGSMVETAVKVFAKAPQPGLAKTRLAPALGERGAAAVARQLLDTVAAMSAALPAHMEVEFQLSPGPNALCWRSVDCLRGRACVDQGGGDLGERLARAALRGLGEAEAVILVGSDCPSLTVSHFEWARRALEHVDAAIIPATDGGYVMLALGSGCGDVSSLFRGVAWSTHRVLEQTRERLRRGGLSWREHDPLPDLDEASDIAAQPASFIDRSAELRSFIEHGNA